MRVSRCFVAVVISITCFVFSSSSSPRTADARDARNTPQNKDFPLIQEVLVIDGSTVLNVGRLWMHVGNWGLFGSMPTAAAPFSFAPSAQWPGGEGAEYLFSSGMWIGALRDGIPAVSTAQYQTEFRPTNDPIDIMYRSHEGAPGGNRYPDPGADDDGDGKVDEDWLNGRDDDGDGKIDEDYAAISDQMFSCWYTDDQPSAIEQFPQHNPLHLRVRQEGYQWRDARFRDIVAVDFKITNIGTDVLEDVYLGFFADFDCGPRTRPYYWADDGTGFVRVRAPRPKDDTDNGDAANLDIAYGYDVDGDGGLTPGYLGILVLDHPTDPTGETAPARVGATGYANFFGDQSFEEGGDPTNDFERYELLSRHTIERNMEGPQDFRALISTGPFKELAPGSTIMFRVAFVIGSGLQGMIETATSAMKLYKNDWYPNGLPIETKLDIQPGMCPNRLVITRADRGSDANADTDDGSVAGGILHAALLGRRSFDVSDVDLRSIRLEGVEPVKKPAFRDVGTEPLRKRECVCPGKEPDGIVDLILAFPKRDVIAAILPVSDGEEKVLRLTGRKRDGQPFRAVDCVRIEMRSKPGRVDADKGHLALRSAVPNPFNPVTRISYYVPENSYVTIAVYDVSGRLVDRLVSDLEEAGEHAVEWNAARVPSGIYFCRLEAGGAVDTQKLIVMK